jgi:uncharacterized protein DUF397
VDASHLAWKKSTWSSTDGCVEVAYTGDQIAVRQSKDPDGPVLVFTPHEWKAFISGVHGGEFEAAQ